MYLYDLHLCPLSELLLSSEILHRVSDWTAVWREVWMHGVLWCHPAHGPSVELPELLPRLPPELHQEMGSVTSLTGRRCEPLNNFWMAALWPVYATQTDSVLYYPLCRAAEQQSLIGQWTVIVRLCRQYPIHLQDNGGYHEAVNRSCVDILAVSAMNLVG